ELREGLEWKGEPIGAATGRARHRGAEDRVGSPSPRAASGSQSSTGQTRRISGDIDLGRLPGLASFSRRRAARHEPKPRDWGGPGGDVLACTNDDVTVELARRH